MKPLFKNPALQSAFGSKGYVTTPLLSQDDLKALLQLFDKYAPKYNTPFHTTHFSTDKDYKAQVNDILTRVVFPRADLLLNDCRPLFGNFMVKNAGSDYLMPLHADWTYVDESRFRSIAIWIPLVDVDERNGCLGVIEGSHKILNTIRGPRIEQTGYRDDKRWVEQLGTLLPVKAGSAIIYDHALLHYSPANQTASLRPAVNLSVVPAQADIFHYCIPEGASDIEVYKVAGSDFYINYNNYQRPEAGTLIKTLAAATVRHIDAKMNRLAAGKKQGIIRRVFGFFRT